MNWNIGQVQCIICKKLNVVSIVYKMKKQISWWLGQSAELNEKRGIM